MCSYDPYQKWADEYDDQSHKYQWHGPAILFGMMFPRLSAGETLLDLGIGTGLGALSFHRTGLKIVGIDSSPSMIERCRSRGLEWTIYQHDLTQTPWPLESGSIDHVVTAGVTHFIRDLRSVFDEVSRVLKPGGLFGFDYNEFNRETAQDYVCLENGIYHSYDAEYAQDLYRHSEGYVLAIMSETGFEMIHNTEFLVSREPKRFFRAVVAERKVDGPARP